MALSCGSQCAKVILFILNALFWVAGLLLIILGGLAISNLKNDDVSKVLNGLKVDQTVQTAAALIIAAGCIIFVVGFCGCCGAIMENRLLLILYSIFLSLIIVCELALAVYLVVKGGDVTKISYGGWSSLFDQYTTNDASKATVDLMQRTLFQCCGISNSSDWLGTAWNKKYSKPVPPSCCKNAKNDTLTNNPEYETCLKDSTQQYNKGCRDAVQTFLSTNLIMIYGVLFGIAAFQIILLIMASCLTASINSSNTRVYSS